MQKFRRFYSLSLREKLILVEASVLLVLAKLLITFVPFRWVAPRLGQLNQTTSTDNDAHSRQIAKRVRRVIAISSHNLPIEFVCFPQAIAGMLMLRRRGVSVTMYLGVARTDEGELKAHAWLRSGVVIVTGYGVISDYTPVATFATCNPSNRKLA